MKSIESHEETRDNQKKEEKKDKLDDVLTTLVVPFADEPKESVMERFTRLDQILDKYYMMVHERIY
jgi:hypothetical protein